MTLTLSPAKIGAWVLDEKLTSAQLNKLATELVKAVDGVGGGTYTLSVGDLTFTGSKKLILDLAAQLTAGKTLNVDGTIELGLGTSRLNVRSGAAIGIFAGGVINVASTGGINLAAGALLTSAAGAQLEGELDVPNASIIKFARAQDLALANETFTRRLYMEPVFVNPAHWGPGTGGAPIWNQLATTVNPLVFSLKGCLPGDVITAVAVELQPATGHGGVPGVQPQLALFSKSGGGAFITSLAATQDNQSTVPFYEAEHAVVLNAGSLISGAMPTLSTDPVYLQVGGEGGANVVAGLKIFSISVIGTRAKIANSHDFG